VGATLFSGDYPVPSSDTFLNERPRQPKGHAGAILLRC